MSTKRLLLQMSILIVLALSACQPATAEPTATAVPTATATLAPTIISYPSPLPRSYVSMAYDSESDKIILFGGQTNDSSADFEVIDDTWAYDVTNNAWTLMKTATGPSGRGAADMAYDSESDRVILFGGARPSDLELEDTWAYDYNTNTWSFMAKGPANHLGSRIAYDAESDRIILFGGYDIDTNTTFNDTWAYDFNANTWTEMKPGVSPKPRNYAGLAYEAESDRTIMWGGGTTVWAYDYNTNTWQEMDSSGGPDLRVYTTLTYNAKADRIIMYGGGEVGNKDTWAYDYNTNTWTELKPATTPDNLSRFALAYSSAADRVILFGGWNRNGQPQSWTWAYDLNANTWNEMSKQP
jgi:N-acetylneuraminic acid mutarotase